MALAKQYHVSTKPLNIRNEWYTPSQYIEAAREVMGNITLDPASCVEANLVVRASHYFTREENGLTHPWQGCIWLNPPFVSEDGKSSFRPWVKKLLDEYLQGNIEQAIALVSAATERKWFAPLWEYPICFTDHQITFNRPKNKPEHLYTCTCFVYLGPHEQRFTEIFRKFGKIIRWNDRHGEVLPRSLWEVASC